MSDQEKRSLRRIKDQLDGLERTITGGGVVPAGNLKTTIYEAVADQGGEPVLLVKQYELGNATHTEQYLGRLQDDIQPVSIPEEGPAQQIHTNDYYHRSNKEDWQYHDSNIPVSAADILLDDAHLPVTFTATIHVGVETIVDEGVEDVSQILEDRDENYG